MSETFLTPPIKRLLWQVQLFLTVVGLVMFIFGAGRVILELLGGLSDLASTLRPDLFTPESFLVGAGLALAGYTALYAAAATGAQEPPALVAIRNSFIAIGVMLVLTVLWLITVELLYMVVMLVLAIGIGWLIFRLWQKIEKQQLWQAFGQPISRSGSRTLFYVVVLLGALVLAGVGIANAVLTDQIELPLPDVKAGELLYTTSFDEFNDEWDFPGGTRKAEIIDGKMVLTLNSGKTDDGFYSLLESRKFRDFDLRVIVEQVSGDIDNSFGVVFRQRDADTYYVFEISGDGYYRLKKVDGNIATNITQWIESPIIQTPNQPNEIRVVGKGDTFTFYVNQQLMPLCTKGENREPTYNHITGECVSNEWENTYQDDSFKQGRIGLAIGNTATSDVTEAIIVAFDNLIIIGPE